MTDLLLNSKRDPEQEYTIHLFEYCNLSCSFCWQDHDSLVGVDDILEIARGGEASGQGDQVGCGV